MVKTIPWWAKRTIEEAYDPRVFDLTNESLRLDSVFEKVCHDIKELYDFDFVAVQIIRPASHYIETVHGIGAAKDWSDRAKHFIESDPELRDIQADIVQTGLTEIIVGLDARFDKWIFDSFEHKNYSRIFIPIFIICDEKGEPDSNWIRNIDYEVTHRIESEDLKRTALKIGPDLTFSELEIIGTIEAGYCRPDKEITNDQAFALFKLASESSIEIYKLLLPYGLKSMAEQVKNSIQCDAVRINFLYDKFSGKYVYETMSGIFPKEQSLKIETHINKTCHHIFTCTKDSVERKSCKEGNCFEYLDNENQILVVFPFLINHLQTTYDEQLLIGAIYIYFNQGKLLSEKAASFVNRFASSLSDTLWNLVTYLKMREQTRQLRILHSITNSLAQTPEDGDLLNFIASSALNILAADVITIYEYVEPEENFLTPPSISGRLKVEKQMRTKLSEDDIPFRLLRHGKDKYTEGRTVDEPLFNSEKTSSFVKREHIESTAGILLNVVQETVGVLFINYRNHHYFSEDDKQIISTLASAAAVAIKNQRWLDTISEVDRDIIATQEPDQLLMKITKKSVLVTAADLGEIRLLDIGSQELVMKARFPEYARIDEKWNRTSIKDGGEGITGWVAHHRKSRIVYDINEEKNIYKPFFADSKSELCVPLLGKEGVLLGVLNVESSQLNNFDGRDQRRLEALADLVVVALQNIQSNEQRMAVDRAATLNHIARAVFHRMNNHLGAANVWAKKIAEGSPDTPELANKIRRAITQALEDRKRIRGWMTDLQPVDVKQVLHLALSRINIPSNIKTEFSFGEDLISKVIGIQGLLEDSFFSIAKNAIDAMPSGGTLSVTGMEMNFNSQKWIIVQINDTGVGILGDNKEAIFSPGYTTKDDHDGEGLWLTKTYIDKLGGQITVDSIPGKGTKVSVLLPAC